MKNSIVVDGLLAILVLLLSLALTLIDIYIPLNLWYHPIANYFCFAFIGYGIFAFVKGITRESPWFFFLSTTLLGCAICYILCYYLTWWVALIICGTIVAIVPIFCFILMGNKTEDIALNKSKDYKTYKQKQEEKENEK